MYGSHHRVAPLRHGAAITQRYEQRQVCEARHFSPADSCNRLTQQCDSQTGTQAAVFFTQRDTSASCSKGPAYTVPPAMQRPLLASSSASQQPQQRGSQPSVPFSQVSQSDGVLTELRGVIRTLSGAVERQERHLETSCQCLAHLSLIAEGQSAQVEAIRALTAEVHAMVDVMRGFSDHLPVARLVECTVPTASSRNAQSGMLDEQRKCLQSSQAAPSKGCSVVRPAREEGGADKNDLGESIDPDDMNGSTLGAAYLHTVGLKKVRLRGSVGSSTASVDHGRPQLPCGEDDIFSM
ncbi:hypothetical protein TRVL_10050 [Trypanosoma vivax]|nr:hypothetical protein TRVL_10050 [Trypanosoma vivax]